LCYGYQRPELTEAELTTLTTATSGPNSWEYDRPTQVCDVLLLWTLPPSWTHLRWLIARAKPSQIYVRNQLPDLPTALTVQTYLETQLAGHRNQSSGQPPNLLAWGQQLWVAPSTLVAGLRELGYACAEFPSTHSLSQELARLERWYLCPAEMLEGLP
jgi:single-stranded-DNA-specific exonuclease